MPRKRPSKPHAQAQAPAATTTTKKASTPSINSSAQRQPENANVNSSAVDYESISQSQQRLPPQEMNMNHDEVSTTTQPERTHLNSSDIQHMQSTEENSPARPQQHIASTLPPDSAPPHRSTPSVQAPVLRIDSKLDERQMISALEQTPLSSAQSAQTHRVQSPSPRNLNSRVTVKEVIAIVLVVLTFGLLLYFQMINPSSRHASTLPPVKPFSKQEIQETIKDIERNVIPSRPLEIHLMWTTPTNTFAPRNYKVIDAYLHHNPTAHIHIHATHMSLSDFAAYTRSGYNITIHPITDHSLISTYASCPGSHWLHNVNHWRTFPYFYSHLTDFLRFCILYLHGGIYSDFDAIQLRPLSSLGPNFIGRDVAGVTDRSCEWCLPGGDMYLAPGVMGAEKGHVFVERALLIGFNGSYDPHVFNSVGPQAITKAYNSLTHSEKSSIHVLDQSVLYPFNYMTSHKVFKSDPDARMQLEALYASSASLHLYGHMTKHQPVEPGSVVQLAFDDLSVVSDELELHTPRFVGVRKGVVSVPVRVAGLIPKSVFSVSLECVYGRMSILKSSETWNRKLVLSAPTVADMNAQLSKLVYSTENNLKHGNDTLTISIITNPKNQHHILVSKTLPLYDINTLVTVMIKTHDRMSKVFTLIASLRKHYPNITIIASDDGSHHHQQPEGQRKQFYYLPLDYDVGLSAGRNAMVQRVSTPFVLTLDDDFILTETSRIEALVHALHVPDPTTGTTYDIAAAKNPADESKFQLDFCGLFHITPVSRVLSLRPGSWGHHQGCHHVDFVPNIFVAKTRVLQHTLGWDDVLKLGEHEDFFLRAKEFNVRVLTCPFVTFTHEQVDHWKLVTEYDRKRARVYDFWRVSLRKHRINRLVSFGKTMMDLEVPKPLEALSVTNILSRTVTLEWKSRALSFKILQSNDHGNSWAPVNYGQGENFEPLGSPLSDDPEGFNRKGHYEDYNSLVIMGLIPGTQYMFRIFAGNRFDFESKGMDVNVKTLTVHEEARINLIKNPDFAQNSNHYLITDTSSANKSSSLTFLNRPGIRAQIARTEITTAGYLNSVPSVFSFHQTIDNIYFSKQDQGGLENQKHQRTLVLSMQSQVDRFFDSYPSWRMEVFVWIRREPNPSPHSTPTMQNSVHLNMRPADWVEKLEFDRSVDAVQIRVERVCLCPSCYVSRVVVGGAIETFRGSVTWSYVSAVAVQNE